MGEYSHMVPTLSLYTHAGVFEGIGGFTMGAQRAGLTTSWVCEINPYRKKILRKNFPDVIQYKDIRKLSNPPTIDILTGGFPCQNISVAGEGSGIIGEQSRLWDEYLRVIFETHSRYVIIENSSLLKNRGLEVVLYDLSKIGYDVQWQCLRATQFGYPHKRERLFIVAYSPEIRRRQERNIQIFQSIDQVFERPPRQVVLPVSIKRIKWNSDHNDILDNHGFSIGPHRRRISAVGDAVLPDIAEYLMRCVKHHYSGLLIN